MELTTILPIAKRILTNRFVHYALLVLAVLFYRHEAQSWHRAYDAQTANVTAASERAKAEQKSSQPPRTTAKSEPTPLI